MRGPNMSYCMCENTLEALEQVYDSMEEWGEAFFEMSDEERRALNKLITLCKDFSEAAMSLDPSSRGS